MVRSDAAEADVGDTLNMTASLSSWLRYHPPSKGIGLLRLLWGICEMPRICSPTEKPVQCTPANLGAPMDQ